MQAPITDQYAQPVVCSSGWTEWINQDTQSVKPGQRKYSDVEPLPTPLILVQ